MKPFEFRLAPLARLRLSHRDARRAEHAEALAEQSRLAACRASLELQLAEHQQLAVRDRQRLLSLEQLLRGERYEASLRQELAMLLPLEQAAITAVASSLAALVEAERELQCLEKLRERRHEEHRQDEFREAIQILDERGRDKHRGDDVSRPAA